MAGLALGALLQEALEFRLVVIVNTLTIVALLSDALMIRDAFITLRRETLGLRLLIIVHALPVITIVCDTSMAGFAFGTLF